MTNGRETETASRRRYWPRATKRKSAPSSFASTGMMDAPPASIERMPVSGLTAFSFAASSRPPPTPIANVTTATNRPGSRYPPSTPSGTPTRGRPASIPMMPRPKRKTPGLSGSSRPVDSAMAPEARIAARIHAAGTCQ